MSDVRLLSEVSLMQEMCEKIKRESLNIQSLIINYGKIDTLNYKIWDSNNLYFWILNIKNHNNQSIFNEYS